MKKFGTGIVAAAMFFIMGAAEARASDLVAGGHFGWAKQSDLVYGVNFTAHPYDMYGLRLDLTFGDGFVSANPAFIVYPVAYEEMAFGILGGPGITHVTGQDTKFGLNIGALGTVKLGPSIEVGLDSRYIFPIEGDGGFMLFATLGFVFNMGDSW